MDRHFNLAILGTLILSSVTGAIEYQHTLHLLDNNEYVVHWSFQEATWIQFKIEVATHGWFGFGLSLTGGMRQADIMTFWVKEGTPFIQDRWSVGEEMPQRDRNSQDWELLHSSENATHTTAEVRRNIYTCDEEDNVVEYGTIRLIWAKSDRDPETEDGIEYHGASLRSRGVKSVELLTERDANIPEKLESDAFPVDIITDKFQIPAVDTAYWCHALKIPKQLQNKEHHLVMAEPQIEYGNEVYVHHMLLYDCDSTLPNEVNQTSFDCDNYMHPARQSCKFMAVGWATGGGALKFPKHVGINMGGQHKARYLLLETHYDNPQLTRGRLDSSGIRLWLTPTKRAHEGGTMTLQNNGWRHMFIPPRMQEHRVYGVCHEDCLSEAMKERNIPEIKIFAFMLHTHLLGRGIVIRHFRGAEELRPIALDEHYDFNFQEQREMAVERTVLPFLGELGYEPKETTKHPYFKLHNPPEHITTQRSLTDVYRQLRWTRELHRRYQQWITAGDIELQCYSAKTRTALRPPDRDVKNYKFAAFVKQEHELNPCSSAAAITMTTTLLVSVVWLYECLATGC